VALGKAVVRAASKKARFGLPVPERHGEHGDATSVIVYK
jgi:hypothetical protein